MNFRATSCLKNILFCKFVFVFILFYFLLGFVKFEVHNFFYLNEYKKNIIPGITDGEISH